MLTPIDIETVQFKKVALGYAPDGVDEFLNRVIVEFENLYKENSSLKDKIKVQEESIKYYQSLEETLKNSIVLAEKTAAAAKKNANDSANNIVKRAHIIAEEIIQKAKNDCIELEAKANETRSRYSLLSANIKNMINSELEYLAKTEEMLNKNSFKGSEEAAAAIDREGHNNEKEKKVNNK